MDHNGTQWNELEEHNAMEHNGTQRNGREERPLRARKEEVGWEKGEAKEGRRAGWWWWGAGEGGGGVGDFEQT